jgi:hypothetical protein
MTSSTSNGSTTGLFLRRGATITQLELRGFAAENELQQLLAHHPELIGGDQVDPDDPRRYVLVKREARVAGLSLDHLFLDQDAVPTLVEVKRSSDLRARREVVAQMLDYAANAASEWNAGLLRQWLLERCVAADADPLAPLGGVLAADPDRYWEQVAQNLRDGKVRLIFVADAIPPSLQRIVEFLNERMVPTEVLAMEVRQYLHDDEQMLQTRVVGQTAVAQDVKGTRRPAVIGVLAEAGLLGDGTDLWFSPAILPAAHRPELGDERLRAKLVDNAGRWNVEYRPHPEAPAEVLSPASAWNAARAAIEPGYEGDRLRAVHDCFSLEPGGPTLGEIAEQRDLW